MLGCLVKSSSPDVWVKGLVRVGEESHVRVQGDARSTSDVQTKLKGNTKMKRVDRNGVEKCGWGMVGFCSSVRSTPFGSEPTRRQE